MLPDTGGKLRPSNQRRSFVNGEREVKRKQWYAGRGSFSREGGLLKTHLGIGLSVAHQPMVDHLDDPTVCIGAKMFINQLAGVLVFLYIVGP